MALAILAPEQLGTSLVAAALIVALWIGVTLWERRQNRTWRVENRDVDYFPFFKREDE